MSSTSFTKTAITLICLVFGSTTVIAQQIEKATNEILKQRGYTFVAQSYSSTTVSMRQITDDYSVNIKKDTITGSLPYYGQSYKAQISLTDGGLKFTSAKFEYSFAEKKKGKCEITIRPKDDRTVQVMYLTVFSDSSAELQVSSTNKEPMTFYGYVGVR